MTKDQLKMLEESFVTKGYASLAISAQLDVSEAVITEAIKAGNLEAKRALFLSENPNVSAKLANQYQLNRILKKQQNGEDLTQGELSFLTKLADQQKADTEEDRAAYYSMTKEKLDREIEKLRKEAYHKSTNKYAPRPNRKKSKAVIVQA